MTPWKPTRLAAIGQPRTRHVLLVCVGLASICLMAGWRSAATGFATIAAAIIAVAGRRYLRRLNKRIDRLYKQLSQQADPWHLADPTYTKNDHTDDEPAAPLIDIAALGSSDPSKLVAATLDRSAFPRLATSIAGSTATEDHTKPTSDSPDAGPRIPEATPNTTQETAALSLTTLNLMRQWKHGLRSGDLAACRRTYAALVDLSDAQAATNLKRHLDELANRVEKALRVEFVAAAQQRDYPALLALGQRIVDLLPDRPIAAEFLRLKPHLENRLPSHGVHEALRAARK